MAEYISYNVGFAGSEDFLNAIYSFYKTIEFTITGINSNRRTRILMNLVSVYHPLVGSDKFFSYNSFIKHSIFKGAKLNKGSVYNHIYFLKNNEYTCPHCGKTFTGLINLVPVKNSVYIVDFEPLANYVKHLTEYHISDYESKQNLFNYVVENLGLKNV